MALQSRLIVPFGGIQTLAFRRSEELTRSAKATMSDERREVAGRPGEIFPGRRVAWFSRKGDGWNGTARRLGIAVDFQSTLRPGRPVPSRQGRCLQQCRSRAPAACPGVPPATRAKIKAREA
jgi:hypothetical protein